MALKADRHEESTDISYFYNAGTATRGGVVCLTTAGLAGASGAALDQGENLVAYETPLAGHVSSGLVPIGILLNDVVNKDLTRTHLNQFKDEVQKGGKVTLMTRGWVVTSAITGTPKAGDVAYASTTGSIAPTCGVATGSGQLAIGRFMSRKDADGYAKVHVNLPSVAHN